MSIIIIDLGHENQSEQERCLEQGYVVTYMAKMGRELQLPPDYLDRAQT